MIQAFPKPQGINRGPACSVGFIKVQQVFPDDPERNDLSVILRHKNIQQLSPFGQKERPTKNVRRLKYALQPTITSLPENLSRGNWYSFAIIS